jgi:surfeit locus 1 family protein
LSAEAPPRTVPPEQRPPAWRVLLSPGMLGVHLFAVVAIAACVLAGSWQYDSYASEQAGASADRSGMEPVPVDELLDPDEPMPGDALGRPVVAEGTYAPAEQQLLVTREHDDREGWWVLSPLLVDGSDAALLVVRGWTDEEVLPPVPEGTVTVTAALQNGEEAGRESVLAPAEGSRVVDVVRLQSLVNVLPHRLYPAFGMRTDEAPPPSDTLEAVSPPAPDPSWTTGLKNLAYAAQWWVFAAFALFMWWRISVDRVRGAGGETHVTP